MCELSLDASVNGTLDERKNQIMCLCQPGEPVDGVKFQGRHSDFKLAYRRTSRFLKSRHFAKNREVSVSRNFAIFWLVVRMCDHRLQCMHSCMQRMQYA